MSWVGCTACRLKAELRENKWNWKTSQIGCGTARTKTASWKRLKICRHHFTWVRSRIHKNWRPGVPRDLTRSNHKFGELQVAKIAIVTAATVAVRPPSSTTAETSEFQHSHEEIYNVHKSNTIWLTDCPQHIRKPQHIHKPRYLAIERLQNHIRPYSCSWPLACRFTCKLGFANCSRTDMFRLFKQSRP